MKYTNQNVINYFKCLEKYLNDFSKVQTTVGVHADKGKDVVDKAVWNEFGTKHISKGYKFIKNGVEYKIKRGTDISIPARPFIRLYLYSDAVLKIKNELAKNVETMALGHKRLKQPLKAVTHTMDNIGRVAKELMKEKMTNPNNYKKNADLTIAIKGFDYPLYDTGELLSSIDSRLERR